MKKIIFVFCFAICSFFMFGKTYSDYDSLYFAVMNDKELSNVEDIENSLNNIWKYAISQNIKEVDYETVKNLLLNPTELF